MKANIEISKVRAFRKLFSRDDAHIETGPEGTFVVLRDGLKMPSDAEIAAADFEAAKDEIRVQRAPMLAESDTMALRYLAANKPVPDDLASYRSALRDITKAKDTATLEATIKALANAKPVLAQGV